VLALAPVATAFAGQGNGVPNSQGANSFGNAVSSGATPYHAPSALPARFYRSALIVSNDLGLRSP